MGAEVEHLDTARSPWLTVIASVKHTVKSIPPSLFLMMTDQFIPA